MKTLYTLALLPLLCLNVSYCMDNKAEQKLFEHNKQQLSPALIEFIQDFQTWPREEQDKITLASNSGGVSFLISKTSNADSTYDGSILYWFNRNVMKHHTIPLYLTLDYIKKQSNCQPQQVCLPDYVKKQPSVWSAQTISESTSSASDDSDDSDHSTSSTIY